jgi:hypothetical protein
MCPYSEPDQENRGSYDTAQICLNGHVVNSTTIDFPEFSKDFCTDCGQKTITQCPQCHTPIQGDLRGVFGGKLEAPRFCHKCGEPYPWTAARITAARELANELDGLDKDDRMLLVASIEDIVRDSPKTTLAATRFRKIVAKGGKVAVDSFRDILVNVAAEAAKRIIWPT